MLTNFVIPLTNVPQQFQITLANVNYLMTVKWNDSADAGWVIDFADANTGDPIVANIPMITGDDLLDGLEYLGFQGSLWVYTNTDTFAVPTLDNLGTDSNLYFQTEVTNG